MYNLDRYRSLCAKSKMMMQMNVSRRLGLYALFIVCLLAILRGLSVDAAGTFCVNDCSGRGKCTSWGSCVCFTGYEGADCSRKQCPTGYPLTATANATDAAHSDTFMCSNQGHCDFKTGSCNCDPGFTGPSCSRMKCYNDCSNHGKCVTLRESAVLNDGYHFNRTTVYNLWDADVMTGCQCDPGWSGADCSERSCEYGADPRTSSLPTEIVTLVCSCVPYTCSGKFKLQFLGMPVQGWFTPSSTATDVANALMAVPGVFNSNPINQAKSVVVHSNSANGKICGENTVVSSSIQFRRNRGDLPALSFYANLVTGGSVMFQTSQILICNCLESSCNGTFRVSFDGEMSPRLTTWKSGDDLVDALRSMRTLQSAAITVHNGASSPICRRGHIMEHNITMFAAMGNVPRLGLWSSIESGYSPTYYRTNLTTSMLTIKTLDGRDDNFKICNGIGTCNFQSGTCSCPFGWVLDPDVGPCGSLQVNTSKYAGLARCPGATDLKSQMNDQSGRVNYGKYVYLSLNPTYIKKEGQREPGQENNRTLSGIYRFNWSPDTIAGPEIADSTRMMFLNLTSNTSAGPILIDDSTYRMFYVDQHPHYPFIGVASLRNSSGRVFLRITYTIFGFALDAHFKRRRLYWTVPAVSSVAGKIYYTSLDASHPVETSLSAVSGGMNYIIDPYGIAVHYIQQRLFWTDRSIHNSSNRNVLRSCAFDGSSPKDVYVYRTVSNVTMNTNLTDIVIDFFHNNTVFLLDVGNPTALLTTNLDFPVYFDNSTDMYDEWRGYYTPRILTDTWEFYMGKPRYLGLYDADYLVLWSDTETEAVAFKRFIKKFLDLFSPGKAYQDTVSKRRNTRDFYPVGLVFDSALGPPMWDDAIDCFGNGVCTGLEGGFVCNCVKGYFGNCLSRSCPVGRAWFHEPAVDNVAHDVYVECSNMGLCDHASGACICRDGFEGPACDRLSCQGRISTASYCNGRGRCLSMRNLAKTRLNDYLEPDAVTYGSLASDPRTWDADMVYGCSADQYGNYKGEYNISTASGPYLDVFECPVGNNVRLRNASHAAKISAGYGANYTFHHEVQGITCYATGGHFQLFFRGQTTRRIYVNSSSSYVQQSLEQLTTIGNVQVEFEEFQSTMCSIANDQVRVTFISQLGKVPLLKVRNAGSIAGWPNPGSVSVVRIQEGTWDTLMECAGMGSCDRSTGMCNCQKYQGSSNGIGAQGTRGDCGYNFISYVGQEHT